MNLSENIQLSGGQLSDLNKKLIDVTFPSKTPVFSLTGSYKPEFDALKLSLGLEANGYVSVFNSEDDKDELGNIIPNAYPVIGVPNSMIRYDLNSKLNASAGYTVKMLDFDFDTEQSILLSYYRIHKNDDTLQKAILDDMLSFKFIYSSEDILLLEKNEGLVVQFDGKISANLKVSASDVYSATLSALAKKFSMATGASAKFEAGASLSFSVTIYDNFKVFVQRKTEDNFLVTINKVVSNTKKAKVEIGITAQLADEDKDLKELTNKILDSMLGESVALIDDLIDNKLNNLSATEITLLTTVFKLINLPIDFSNGGLIKKEYEDYKTKFVSEVVEVLKEKLSIGFTFEYQRTDSTNTLFKANFTSEAIRQNLRNIVMLNPSALEGKQGISISEYLLSNSSETSRKFGFALQFGDFKAYWKNDRDMKTSDTLNKINKQALVVFTGQKTHSHGLWNETKWFFNFKAQMKDPIANPTMADFDYSSTIHWENQQKNTTKEELYDFVDMGYIWKCIPKTGYYDEFGKISAFIHGKKNVKFSCHINIPEVKMKAIIEAMAAPEQGTIERALSDTMAHYSNWARKNVTDMSIYDQIWSVYLKEDNESRENYKDWAVIGHNNLIAKNKSLAEWEEGYNTLEVQNDSGYQSFVGIIENNDIGEMIIGFTSAMNKLNSEIKGNIAYSKNLIEHFFLNTDDLVISAGANKLFNIAFLGRYFLNTADMLGLANEIESFMTIEYQNKDEKTEVITYVMNKV